MQFLALFSSWISIAIIYAPIALSSSFFLERDLPDVAPDPSPFNDEPSLEDINPWDQDIGLDSNGLLAGNALTPITESDSNWSLDENGYLDESGSNFLPADNDIACGVDDVGNTQLFGKVRRENLCRDPPVGQAGKPDGSGQDPFAELNKFITDTVALASFPEDLQVCPVKNFETSNIPVCKEDNPDDVVTIPEFHGFYLFNIDPSAAISTFNRHLQPLLIESAKWSSYHALRVLHCGVAAMLCTSYVLLQMYPSCCPSILTS